MKINSRIKCRSSLKSWSENSAHSFSGTSAKMLSKSNIKRKVSVLKKPVSSVSSSRVKKCLCVDNGEAVDFPKVWNELRQNRQLCDGVIQSEDQQLFHIHRAILSAVSPYFKAVFINSLHSGRPETVEIKLKDIDADLLSLILDYAYTGDCQVTDSNVERLLPAADQLECSGLVKKCCRFLYQQLRPQSCLEIYKFARDYFCTELQRKGWNYIKHHFEEILAANTEFEKLNAEEVIDIISEDQLNVRNETIVFEAVARWIRKNPRKVDFDAVHMLSCVRYGLINYHFFKENVLIYKQLNDDCFRLLTNADEIVERINAKQTDRYEISKNPMCRPRVPYEIIFAIGGWSDGSPKNLIETYDTRANVWFVSDSAEPIPRAYHGVVSLNNLIYVVGGFDGNEHFNTMKCFDPLTKVWSEKACMYCARCYVSVCTLDDKIFVMGGFNGRTRMSSAEVYIPEKNQWEMIAPMNKQRSDSSAASLNMKIYVAGGFNGQEVLDSAEVYDVRSNQWTFISHMESGRSGVSLVAFKGALYALGGFNGFFRLNSGEKYDPSESEEWESIPAMVNPRSNFATAITDDMIFVIGGFNGVTTIEYTECYNPEMRQWFQTAPMNYHRSALAACVCCGLENSKDYTSLSKFYESEMKPEIGSNGDMADTNTWKI